MTAVVSHRIRSQQGIDAMSHSLALSLSKGREDVWATMVTLGVRARHTLHGE